MCHTNCILDLQLHKWLVENSLAAEKCQPRVGRDDIITRVNKQTQNNPRPGQETPVLKYRGSEEPHPQGWRVYFCPLFVWWLISSAVYFTCKTSYDFTSWLSVVKCHLLGTLTVLTSFFALEVMCMWSSRAEAPSWGLAVGMRNKELGTQRTELWNSFCLTPPLPKFSSFFSCLRIFFPLGVFLFYVIRGFFFPFKCSLNPVNHEIWKAERRKKTLHPLNSCL